MRDTVVLIRKWPGSTADVYVQAYAEPVGYEPIYDNGWQSGGHWILETVGPEFRLPDGQQARCRVTEQELRAACKASRVPYPAFLEPKGV